MSGLLERRRDETRERIERLRGELGDSVAHCGDRVCVYMTGSFGRAETSDKSDLDVFIAGEGTTAKPALSRLDEILIKADLIDATRKLGIPDFSGDGEYLRHYTVGELVNSLGEPEDDVSNTFTARLLLLLESSALIGEGTYGRIIRDVISAYWEDYQDHKHDFMPAFLANDILRMWRTFCVNYEARTQREPEEERVKRRIKNYKLKHSRLLTCYSALLYLLAIFKRSGTVSPVDAEKMISITPTQRLEWMLRQSDLASVHSKISELLQLYEKFLITTEEPKDKLTELFRAKETKDVYVNSAYRFGDLVSEVLDVVGGQNRFYRLLVV